MIAASSGVLGSGVPVAVLVEPAVPNPEGLPMPQSPAPMCSGPAVPVLDPGIRVPRELLREAAGLLVWVPDDVSPRLVAEVLRQLDALLAEPPAFVNPGNETGAIPVGWVDRDRGGGA